MLTLCIVTISATKNGVQFSSNGEIGTGSVMLKQSVSADDSGVATQIELEKSVTLTFALKYLTQFTKATPLSDTVKFCMQEDLPMLVEYNFGDAGYVRYYLAPKIGDEDN